MRCERDRGEDGRGDWEPVEGEVDRLPGVAGWFVLHLGTDRSAALAPAGRTRRGFVAVTARLGGSTWDTSLMPRGDGRLFLALPAQVRRAEGVDDGDRVSCRFRLRVPSRRSPSAVGRA